MKAYNEETSNVEDLNLSQLASADHIHGNWEGGASFAEKLADVQEFITQSVEAMNRRGFAPIVRKVGKLRELDLYHQVNLL